MADKTIKIEKYCPFCAGKHLKVINKSFSSIGSYSIYCEKCLCHGPNGPTIEEAIHNWNLRL